MPKFGFVGATYANQSLNADAQMTCNWYPEKTESGDAASPLILLPTPGLKVFLGLGSTAVRALYTINGRLFAICGATLYEIFSNGTSVSRGTVANDSLPASMAASPQQLLIASGGVPYIFDLTLNTLTPISETGNISVATPNAANPGSGFAVGDQVNVVQSGGTGAVLQVTAQTGGHLSLATPAAANPGSGFATGDQVDVVQAGGSGGVLQVTAESGGIPTAYSIVSPGQGYTTASGVTLSVATGAGTAGQANVTAAGVPTAYEIVDAGSGYTTATGVSLSVASGTGTAGEADITAGFEFPGPVTQVGICDDFFLALIGDSSEFFVSAPLDATDWDTNGSAIVEVLPDNIVGMMVDHREIWFWSDRQAVVYYDSGNTFPFDVIPGAFIETGLAAAWSPAQLDNVVFWLGADSRGRGIVYRAYGYTPLRVSNHAVEYAWSQYSRIDDAIGFGYQDQGHSFYVLYFPAANATWVYDVATGMWHQRGYWLGAIAQFGAARYQNHAFAFGMHLVGDWASSNVYQMSIPVSNGSGGWNFADDNGNPIRRVRRAPHIASEQKFEFISELQVYAEAGVGPIPPLEDGAGNPRDPQLVLRWSTDGGHSWSNRHTRGFGQAGKYRTRARWLRLGRGRDFVFELSCSDPVPARIVDAYIEIEQGTGV